MAEKKTASEFPATKAEREWLRDQIDRRRRKQQSVKTPTFVEKQAEKKPVKVS